jgi:hypothetical protein
MQSGAPHSIFGTYVEMMQHASLLKRAVAVSFLTIAAVQSVCRHSHPSPAAAASQSAASAHTVGACAASPVRHTTACSWRSAQRTPAETACEGGGARRLREGSVKRKDLGLRKLRMARVGFGRRQKMALEQQSDATAQTARGWARPPYRYFKI